MRPLKAQHETATGVGMLFRHVALPVIMHVGMFKVSDGVKVDLGMAPSQRMPVRFFVRTSAKEMFACKAWL